MVLQRRGKSAAVVGALLQLAFTAAMVALWLTTGSAAAMASTVLLAGGVLVWAMTALLFYARQMERREAMELEEIARTGETGAGIFEGEDVEGRPAARRRAWIERWLVGAFTLLWAAYDVGLALLLLGALSGGPGEPAGGGAVGMVFCVLVAFLGFLLSRYATGMSRRKEWRPLRASGSYLLLCVLFVAATAVAFGARTQGYDGVGRIVAWVAVAALFVQAAELLLNFVMDLYRPRVPGQEQRLSYDSRLLALMAEPGRVGRSLAEAVNYQFGFEVSKTWFYQLVGKAFVPLVVLAALVLIGMTSIVVVPAGEEAVVLHWGRPQEYRVLSPGLHFKWPWPVDTATWFDTGKVRQVMLGAGRERTEQELETTRVDKGVFKGRELLVWTQEHGRREELDFMIAIPPDRVDPEDAADQQRPPVNLIKLVAIVQYKIDDVYKWGFDVKDAPRLLEYAAYREMTRYCASATLTEPLPGETDRPEAIMTYGRKQAADELRRRIADAVGADGLDLGVNVTYVGLLAVHPPAKAAEAFEEVFKAERKQDLLRYQAEAEANATLARMAGEPADALKLALSIRKLEELSSLTSLEQRDAFEAELVDDIARIREDIRTLEEEIARERLLGQTGDAGRTARQQLRDEQEEYLGLLERIAEAGRSYDLGSAVAAAQAETDRRFAQAAGEPAAQVARARAERWKTELSEKARAELFRSELLAYEASPNVYMLDRWLDVLDRVLPSVTKYILAADRNRFELRLDWKREPGLMEGVTFGQEQPAVPQR